VAWPGPGCATAAGPRVRGFAARLGLRRAQGREEAQAAVRRITGELPGPAERAAADAERLLANARSALRRAKARAAELAARHRSGIGRNPAGLPTRIMPPSERCRLAPWLRRVGAPWLLQSSIDCSRSDCDSLGLAFASAPTLMPFGGWARKVMAVSPPST
jgi:hypothetical protein